MVLTFVEHADVRFEKAPLSTVLCQLKYKPVMSLLSEVGVAGFAEAVRPEYPNQAMENETQLQASPGQLGIQQGAPTWRFTSGDDHWRVGLAVDFLALETDGYETFDDFLSRFTKLLSVLERTVHPEATTRVGLRKVNQIRRSVREHYDWVQYVNPTLLCALAYRAFPADVVFGMSDLRFKDDDNVMAVRHGLFPDTTDNYVIDIDYYTERPYAVGTDAGLEPLLEYFSKGMTSFFHWAVTDELKSELGPVSRKQDSR